MITAILIMLWLISCAVCAALGVYIGRSRKPQRPVVKAEPSEEEKRQLERELREIENFFKYDGTEQRNG